MGTKTLNFKTLTGASTYVIGAAPDGLTGYTVGLSAPASIVPGMGLNVQTPGTHTAWRDSTSLPGNDISASVVLASPVGTESVGCGLLDDDGNGYIVITSTTQNNFRVFYSVAWNLSGSPLLTIPTAPINGATIKFNLVGDIIRIYQNGTKIGSDLQNSLYAPKYATAISRGGYLQSMTSEFVSNQSIVSINGGQPLRRGQTSITVTTTGFTVKPTATTSTPGLTFSNVQGSNNVWTMDLVDFADGVIYPQLPIISSNLTLTAGEQVAVAELPHIEHLSEETVTVFTNPVYTARDYLGNIFFRNGIIPASGDEFIWTISSGLPSGLTIGDDSFVAFSSGESGVIQGWYRTVSDNKMHFATITVSEVGADSMSEQFYFASKAAVALNSSIQSNFITIAGVSNDAAVPYTLDVGTLEKTVAGSNTWNTVSNTGTVGLGDRLRINLTSGSTTGVVTTATLAVGSTSAKFVISTGQPTNVPISITGGEYQVSMDGGNTWDGWTSAAGTVRLNYLVRVRVMSSVNGNATITATLTIGDVVRTYSATTAAVLVITPVFTIQPKTNVDINTAVESASFNFTGAPANENVPIQVTNGTYSINGGVWTSSNGYVKTSDSIKVKRNSSNSPLTAVEVLVNIGGTTHPFTLTTRAADVVPNSLTFNTRSAVSVGAEVISNVATLSGVDDSIDIPFTVNGGTASIYNGDTWSDYVTSGFIRIAYKVRLKGLAPSEVDSEHTVTISISNVDSTFIINTNVSEVTVDPFVFESEDGVEPLTYWISDYKQITGMSEGTQVLASIEGGEFNAVRNGLSSGWLSQPTYIPFGCHVCVRVLSSSLFNTSTGAALTVGNVTTTYSVTTRAARATPKTLLFKSLAGVESETLLESNALTIKGIDAGVEVPIEVVNGEYNLDTGLGFQGWTSEESVVGSGTKIKLRHTSASAANTVTNTSLIINNINCGVFTTVTRATPVVPAVDDLADEFTIVDRSNVEPGILVSSAEFTISGISDKIEMLIEVDGGFYTVNDSTYLSRPTKVKLGDRLRLICRSSVRYGATNQVAVRLGSLIKTFTVQTRAIKDTPIAFAFGNKTKVSLLSTVESNEITVRGIDPEVSAPISVSGDIAYSVNRGFGFESPTTGAGHVTVGTKVKVYATTDNTYSSVASGTLTIGDVSASFSATNRSGPVAPKIFASIAKRLTPKKGTVKK